jgi:hypothetical protein
MSANREQLRIALLISIGLLIAAIFPIWPYGYYGFLRLAVSATAAFALYVLGSSNPVRTVFLAAVIVLFNPVIPVHLSRAVWLPINLGVAVWFWTVIHREVLGGSSSNRPE